MLYKDDIAKIIGFDWKTADYFGWKAETELGDGIQQTVDFYKKRLDEYL